jgi:membrane protease YdiL (CAAX protease family)
MNMRPYIRVIRKILIALWAAILGLCIALLPQGIWSALVAVNLKTGAAVPWAVAAMALLLWLMWQYLGGRWAPIRTALARRNSLRARPVPAAVFGWAVLAGVLAIVALVGLWIVLARLVRMPGSVLPDMSAYPRLTVLLMLAMGSLVSPICEQAGLWGYCQTRLEREFPSIVALILTSALFAILPHPPFHTPLLPKLLFFFLTGLTFSLMARLTNSILPGLLVHIAGILFFFTIIWPTDPLRRLITQTGPDPWFAIDLAQTLVFTLLATTAFIRLAEIDASLAEAALTH